MLTHYVNRWGLVPDGQTMLTPSAQLLPVRCKGMPAMLKIALHEEERIGAAVMAWWEGSGAAKVLAHDGAALLLERAEGGLQLTEMARDGRDDEASRIICAVLATLHTPRTKQPPVLTNLSDWFHGLELKAGVYGGVFAMAALAARELLASPQDICVLHGDIHHSNILDFGQRGWLAIDPKGLIGERGFDYANLFCNPDAETAILPDRFSRRVQIVAEMAELEPRRLLQWVLAWAGLSAAWHIEDGSLPDTALSVAHMALSKL